MGADAERVLHTPLHGVEGKRSGRGGGQQSLPGPASHALLQLERGYPGAWAGVARCPAQLDVRRYQASRTELSHRPHNVETLCFVVELSFAETCPMVTGVHKAKQVSLFR